jgi:iron(II)-dependent oxidoreductase
MVFANAWPAALASGSNLLGWPRRVMGAIHKARAPQLGNAASPRSARPPERPTDDAPRGATGQGDRGAAVDSLVEEMLTRGRYALLLRPRLVGNLTREQLTRAREALADSMCLVPAGDVSLSPDSGDADSDVHPTLRLEAYYLDRYPVTNAQFHNFVERGGYEQMAIWDPEVVPAVLDFVDEAGNPGPRFWRGGHFPIGEENYPVIGISWYEAAAYARWVGKRLPSDGEWVKAGSWPVAIDGRRLIGRRHPWGEAMDRSRANLWGSGPGRTVAVDQYPGGVSVGGVQQLIGNVWEWTAESFAIGGQGVEQVDATNSQKMNSIRGGAFDTYLDSQATCYFGSGERVLARKHNIGLRCAISLCDLPNRESPDEPSSARQLDPSLAENQS